MEKYNGIASHLYLNNFLDEIFNETFDEDFFSNSRCPGFTGLLNTFTNHLHFPNYPHNIYLDDEKNLYFEIAAQAFSKDEIKIEVDDSNKILIVELKKSPNTEKETKHFIVNKIKQTDVSLQWKLSRAYNTDQIETTLQNGMIKIKIPVSQNQKESKRLITIQ